jgi:hypothetical protein
MESSVWSLRTTQDRGDVLAMTAVYEKSPFLG